MYGFPTPDMCDVEGVLTDAGLVQLPVAHAAQEARLPLEDWVQILGRRRAWLKIELSKNEKADNLVLSERCVKPCMGEMANWYKCAQFGCSVLSSFYKIS